MNLPTIQIVNPNDPESFLIINKSDFDSAIHTPWDERHSVEVGEAPTVLETGFLTVEDSPRADREVELMTLYFGESGDESNWRPIKAIADSLGIPKPDGGWDNAIPLILEKEYGE